MSIANCIVLTVSVVVISSAITRLLLIQFGDAEVPRLATSSMVPPNLNKLPVVGQTPYKADGPDPQQTPSPLHSTDKQTPLQIYETNRPFFGSAPVGGLDILCSELALPSEQCCGGLCSRAVSFCQKIVLNKLFTPALSANAANSPVTLTYRNVAAGFGKDKEGQLENVQYHPVSGADSQQQLHKVQNKNKNITRRNSWNGRNTLLEDMLGTGPHSPRKRPSKCDVASH